jgi:multiple sugar transport system ATP-binding protein
MTLADRIAIMKGGKIMQLSSPDEIYNKPRNLYVADFIGSPSMNFLEGHLEAGSFKVDDMIMPMTGYEFAAPQTADRPAVIGIRPEHVVTGELVGNAPLQYECDIDLVEPMGSDTLVYAKLGNHPFRIRMDGQAKVRAGETIAIGIDPSKASLFDKSTEDRL